MGSRRGGIGERAGLRRETPPHPLCLIRRLCGQREWTDRSTKVGTWIGEAANLVWSLPDSRVVALTPGGRATVLSVDGEVVGKMELGEAITALPRPGNHRGPDRSLILGTAQGRVLVLP
jgi:hypothetical protein